MQHGGYTARIEYDDEDGLFVGRVLGLRALVDFHGETVAELRKAMQLAVDEYVASCKKRGVKPEKAATGNFALRMPPEVHGAAAVVAEAAGKSLNQLISEAVARMVSDVSSINAAARQSAQMSSSDVFPLLQRIGERSKSRTTRKADKTRPSGARRHA